MILHASAYEYTTQLRRTIHTGHCTRNKLRSSVDTLELVNMQIFTFISSVQTLESVRETYQYPIEIDGEGEKVKGIRAISMT